VIDDSFPEPHHHKSPMHIDDLLKRRAASIRTISSSHADELDDFSRVDIISSTRESDEANKQSSDYNDDGSGYSGKEEGGGAFLVQTPRRGEV
jgi:hypothetical protein